MAIKHLITTIIIYISIERIQSWLYSIPGSDVNYKINENDTDYFPWTVLFGKHLESLDASNVSEYEFYHGSLIHPQAVFIGTTTQLQLDNGDRVMGGCNFFEIKLDIQKCQTREVSDVIVGKYYNNKNNEISDSNKKFEYVNIVILNQPFELNDRIEPIRLAESNDMIDINNCFFSSLQNLIIFKHRVPLMDEFYNLLNEPMRRFFYGNGSILYEMIDPIVLPIFGSPVVCQDRFDTQKYLQIGYLRAQEIITSTGLSEIKNSTFFNIVPVQNEIRRKLNSYFNPNDHTLSLWYPHIWNLKINSSNTDLYIDK